MDTARVSGHHVQLMSIMTVVTAAPTPTATLLDDRPLLSSNAGKGP